MITAATSKYVCASMPPTSTTTDHVQAASVPTEISVSIVAAPWRAFRSVARWNPRPHQNTTGVASTSATHSQPSNWSGGTIATTTRGAVRSTATASLVRTARTASGPAAAACCGSAAW